MKILIVLVILSVTAASASPQIVPFADYHQHLVSPAFAPVAKVAPRDGAALVKELDAAGIQRAVVLSVAYSFADERKGLADPDRLTRDENDWTSGQVSKNAPRLVGFCSANPLRAAALQELSRCLGLPGMAGIKLHLGNSGLSLRDAGHVAVLQDVFRLAAQRRVPVLLHMRARGGLNYGAEDARLFLEKVVPVAPDIPIIVAHLGSSGPGYSSKDDAVLAVFAAAVQAREPVTRNLYFDVATNVAEDTTPDEAALVARRIRQLGTSRVLYGSDLNPPGGSILTGWEIFASTLPLTQEELRQIANNRAAFLP